jgi:hypothetical protein
LLMGDGGSGAKGAIKSLSLYLSLLLPSKPNASILTPPDVVSDPFPSH